VAGGADAAKLSTVDAIWETVKELYAWVGNQPKAHGELGTIDGVQVICAKNTTRQLLNARLQLLLNPDGERGHSTFRTGDKVICLKNGFFDRAGGGASGLDDIARNPGQKDRREFCANGDIGRVVGFQGRRMVVRLASPDRVIGVPLAKHARRSEPAADDGQDGGGAAAPEGEGGAKGWALAYAITCHKAQGSEAPCVFVCIEAGGQLGSREWIYTALSRARNLCVVVGEQREITRHVNNVTLPCRRTFLKEMILGEVPLQ
jgi:ATP-dependent exoDNAse (exonuclease V) alpha subunit